MCIRDSVDIPLDTIDKSGHFVLAKWSDEDSDLLEMTGFKVPQKTALFLPGGVIHTNNYLAGTWRTMLADGPINEGKLYAGDRKIRFKFASL